jgi:CRP-like cAMP-binding protein
VLSDDGNVGQDSQMTVDSSSPLAAVPLFAALDRAILSELERSSQRRSYAGGQVLFSEGDPGDALLVLESGSIRISRFSASGQEIVLNELTAPAAIGELALIDHQPRSATATAVGPVVVRWLRSSAFDMLLDRDPGLMRALLEALVSMVRDTNERLTDLLALDVAGRLAKWLLKSASDNGSITLEQSQSMLASALGTTRVTVNRALNRFERLHLISIDRQLVQLLDIPALRSIASM